MIKMAECQLVKSSSWSSFSLALAVLFISISTKSFLLYDMAKLRPIFTLMRQQLLESKLDHSCHNAISVWITIAFDQLQQSLLCQWKGDRGFVIDTMKWAIYSSGGTDKRPGMFLSLTYSGNDLLYKVIHELCLCSQMQWYPTLFPSNHCAYTMRCVKPFTYYISWPLNIHQGCDFIWMQASITELIAVSVMTIHRIHHFW